ncbi:hypothetical protein RHSIM_Rhsim07G0122700 [Rhododendron simsii]|uniref:Uncharacterized protein n=1 Tax=Rhododendron simsii TaxID=118357 RepID=A0A834GRT5_RHOSS|nr:hypothetical protein RHSIM_Rhsim07G0122700 [Rhododendron simsii]
MAHLLKIDQAFENMSVHEISTCPEEIPTTLLSSKIISDHTHSTSSSSPIILPRLHSYSPSKKVLVVMGKPPARTGFHRHRSLAMSRYYPSYMRDSPHLSLLDSLLASSLCPTFYRIEETPGFVGYGELRKRAKSQFSHWVNEVRRPHYSKGFIDDSPSLYPLPKEPNWFDELASLKFDPPLYQPKFLSSFAFSLTPMKPKNFWLPF